LRKKLDDGMAAAFQHGRKVFARMMPDGKIGATKTKSYYVRKTVYDGRTDYFFKRPVCVVRSCYEALG